MQTMQKIYPYDWVSLIKRNGHVFFFLSVCSFSFISLYEVTCQPLFKFLVVRWPLVAFYFYGKDISMVYI